MEDQNLDEEYIEWWIENSSETKKKKATQNLIKSVDKKQQRQGKNTSKNIFARLLYIIAKPFKRENEDR